MRHRTLFALVLFASLLLVGCQGISSALGITPEATAPVYNGIAVVVLPGGHAIVTASPDQSGAVGAEGSGELKTEAEQTNTVDPAAVAGAITEVAALVTPGGAAATMLGSATEALEAGDAELAAARVEEARALAENE